MALKIIELFGSAVLVDAGRPGFRKYGVPVGGAFDRECFRLANTLIENQPCATALEFALGTITFEATEDTTIAIVGAAEYFEINNTRHAANCCTTITKGSILRIAPRKNGLRTYLALQGGIAGNPILGSYSGIVLNKGDSLRANRPNEIGGDLISGIRPTSLQNKPFRVTLLSLEVNWLNQQYQASHHLDRVGIRLLGDSGIENTRSITSEPSVFGIVQLTEDAQLILHGPDGPTITGYRKIACIVEEDLDRLGQIAPNDEVTFESAPETR